MVQSVGVNDVSSVILRCQLFTGCSGCNTYDELMEKHCRQFPFFGELLSSAHLNYKQKQTDISTLLSESNTMPFTQSDIELLRASSNIDTSGSVTRKWGRYMSIYDLFRTIKHRTGSCTQQSTNSSKANQ